MKSEPSKIDEEHSRAITKTTDTDNNHLELAPHLRDVEQLVMHPETPLKEKAG